MIAEHYPAYENKPWQPSNSPLRQRKSAQRYWLFDLGAERQSAVECAGFLNLGEVSDPGLLDLRSSTILARKQRWHRIYSLSGWIAQVFDTRESSILRAFSQRRDLDGRDFARFGRDFGTHPATSRANLPVNTLVINLLESFFNFLDSSEQLSRSAAQNRREN